MTSSHKFQLSQCTVVVVVIKVDTSQLIIILSALGLVSHVYKVHICKFSLIEKQIKLNWAAVLLETK